MSLNIDKFVNIFFRTAAILSKLICPCLQRTNKNEISKYFKFQEVALQYFSDINYSWLSKYSASSKTWKNIIWKFNQEFIQCCYRSGPIYLFGNLPRMQGLAKELFLKQGYSKLTNRGGRPAVTVWTTCKKFKDFLPNWQFWWQRFKCFQLQTLSHCGREIEEIESISRPSLACCCWSWSVDCGGGGGWKWLTVVTPSYQPSPSLLLGGKTVRPVTTSKATLLSNQLSM